MRDFADQLERQLVIAARIRARRAPWRAPTLARPAQRWLSAAAALAATAAVAVVALSSAPASRPQEIRAQVVSFRYPTRGADSGDIVATVTDPFAAQSSLNAAFQAAGIDLVVTLVPASPSAVGTVVAMSLSDSGAQIQTLDAAGCASGGGACPIGLEIPRDYTGSGDITLGRPAQPGETYAVAGSAFAAGESLHCSGLFGAQVSAALPRLQADALTVQWSHLDAGGTTSADATPPPGDYYIWSAVPILAGSVRIDTQPTPPPADLVTNAQRYDQGCAG